MPTLILTLPDGKELECELGKNQILLGRGVECDVVLTSESVSVQHATLARDKEEEGTYILTDLGSTNGIKVNGIKVDRAELSGGEKVKIGGIPGEFVADGEKPKGIAAGGEKGRDKEEKSEEKEKKPRKPEPGRPVVRKGTPPDSDKKIKRSDQEDAPVMQLKGKGKSRPGVPRRKPNSYVQEDSQAYSWFFAGVLVFLALLFGLCLRHFVTTGGFFPADFYDKVRVIEVAPSKG